jgi:PAS domain-containing protein
MTLSKLSLGIAHSHGPYLTPMNEVATPNTGSDRPPFEPRFSEQQLKTITDTIPTLAWSTDADGSAEFINQRWLDYTGLSVEQARGWGWKVALHPDEVDWIVDRWRRFWPATMAA